MSDEEEIFVGIVDRDDDDNLHQRGTRSRNENPNSSISFVESGAPELNHDSGVMKWDLKVQLLFGVFSCIFPASFGLSNVQSLFLTDDVCDSSRLAFFAILVIGSVGLLLSGLGAVCSTRFSLNNIKTAAFQTLEQAQQHWEQVKPFVDEIQAASVNQISSLPQQYYSSRPLQLVGFVGVTMVGSLLLFIALYMFVLVIGVHVEVIILAVIIFMALELILIGLLYYLRNRITFGTALAALFFGFLILVIIELSYLIGSLWIAIVVTAVFVLLLGAGYLFRSKLIMYYHHFHVHLQGESLAVVVLTLLPIGFLSGNAKGSSYIHALQGASYGALAVHCSYMLVLFVASSPLILACFQPVPKAFVVLLLLFTLLVGILSLANAVLCFMNHASKSHSKNTHM